MYWIWATEVGTDADPVFFETPAIVDELNLHFDTGAPQATDMPLIQLERAEGWNSLTDNLVAPGVNGLVFSKRLRQLLAAVGVDNVQYYDFSLSSADKSVRDYQIANIVGRIACVDESRSVLELDPDSPGRAVFIDSLALNEQAGGFDLFRLHEESSIVVASDRVRRACLQARVTGVRFYNPSDFCL
jgi:hypothetical protein